MSTNKHHLATVERLNDPQTGIESASLKFWRKNLDEFTDFQLSYLVHLGQIGTNVQVCNISNTMVAVCLGNEEVKVWKCDAENKWTVVASLSFQNLPVRQIQLCKLRFKQECGPCLALLHEEGCLSFWSINGWQLESVLQMHASATKVIFEASFRYLAALKSNGSVSVWRLKGEEPSHQWDLNFTSVQDIVVNSAIEN